MQALEKEVLKPMQDLMIDLGQYNRLIDMSMEDMVQRDQFLSKYAVSDAEKEFAGII